MYDQTQLRKGTLEGCILKIINKEVTYGYEIVTKLQEAGFKEIKEGTIYPLLVRLEKKGIILAQIKASPLGPSRKYYELTSEGSHLLSDFEEAWKEVSNSVGIILNGEASYEK